MRGQHVVAVQHREQLLRVFAEHGQGVRIDHQAGAGARQGEQVGHGGLVDPGRRTDHGGVHGGGGLLQFHIRLERAQHHRFQVRAVDHQGVGRGQQGDQTGADAQSAARRQSRRAGGRHIARHHDHSAAGMLVRVRPRPGHAGGPQGRTVLLQPGGLGGGQSDVGHDDLAAQVASRQQHMGGLLAVKGHRGGGLGSIAERPARIARQAGRQVHSQDRGFGRGGGAQQRLDAGLQRPVQTGAEQGVDDHSGTREQALAGAFHRSVP